MRKSRLSLAEAKEKYPDWYERRIVKKERRGRWTVKRDLYDWWLHRIGDEIRVGHRFYGIMTLAIYAKKCGISEDELRRDAFSLLKPYDDMSVEDINRFTKDDVVCALEMFNEDYVTFPRDDIAKLTGLIMPVNKRNWRSNLYICKAQGRFKRLTTRQMERIGGKEMGGLLVAEQLRIGCMSGASSIQGAVRPIATGTRGLTPKRSESGGTVCPRLFVSRMDTLRCALPPPRR